MTKPIYHAEITITILHNSGERKLITWYVGKFNSSKEIIDEVNLNPETYIRRGSGADIKSAKITGCQIISSKQVGETNY